MVALSSLFAPYSGYKQFQEPVRVDVNTNFRVGRDLVHTFNHVAIAVEHVPFYVTIAIRYGLAASELASRTACPRASASYLPVPVTATVAVLWVGSSLAIVSVAL